MAWKSPSEVCAQEDAAGAPATPSRPGRPWQTGFHAWRWRFLIVFLVLSAWAWWQVPRILENVDVVIPGCAYRSSQLTPAALERYTVEYGLRSLINLRGSNPDCVWYHEEREAAARLGLRHYDISTDSRYPYAAEIRDLIETLETCPRPVLLHCNSGIDRTGTAAVIALLLLDASATPATAESHFGWTHLQIPWRANAIGQREFLDLYRQWLSDHDLVHTRATFRHWALKVYERPAEVPPYAGER